MTELLSTPFLSGRRACKSTFCPPFAPEARGQEDVHLLPTVCSCRLPTTHVTLPEGLRLEALQYDVHCQPFSCCFL
jgi:hypothetical protein